MRKSSTDFEEEFSWWEFLWPERSYDFRAIRAVVLVLLAWWGIVLARVDLVDGFQSVMHGPLLIIHEAGHVLFIPFGEFLHFLGGSFFQVFLPFALSAAFLWKNRDPFGAGVCLWWTGISFIDLAPYIYDAQDKQLPLLSGDESGHDWAYLLGTTGLLHHCFTLGRAAWFLGALISWLGLIWAGLSLWRATPAEE